MNGESIELCFPSDDEPYLRIDGRRVAVDSDEGALLMDVLDERWTKQYGTND